MTGRGIGAVLTLPDLTREQLLEYLADNPELAPAIARELAGRLAELEQLADLAARYLHPAREQAAARVERMRQPGRRHRPEKIQDAILEREELGSALAIARKWSPLRRRILDRLGGPAA